MICEGIINASEHEKANQSLDKKKKPFLEIHKKILTPKATMIIHQRKIKTRIWTLSIKCKKRRTELSCHPFTLEAFQEEVRIMKHLAKVNSINIDIDKLVKKKITREALDHTSVLPCHQKLTAARKKSGYSCYP